MAEEKKKEKVGFFGEFKKFIARGNIVDLAVGIIIGGAFTAIVNSLVNDVLMPLLSLVKEGGFENMYVGLIKEGLAPEGGFALKNGAIIEEGEQLYRTYIYYGNFIQQIINFFLVAFSLFIIVKTINHIRERAEEANNQLRENAREAKKKLGNLIDKDNKEEVTVEEIKDNTETK